ncbi:T9SS type A sorting domain-containing protein [bacterium]|nr:T9SS type A sorting domain-containing protein [bacterium]
MKYFKLNIILSKALLGALFLLVSFNTSAQISIRDHVFPTNFDSIGIRTIFQRDYIDYDDSTLIYSQVNAGSNNVAESIVFYWINKNDLSIRDSNVTWQKDSTEKYIVRSGFPVSILSQFVVDQKYTNNRIYVESYVDSNSTLNLEVRNSTQAFKADSNVLFTLSLEKQELASIPYLYDNSFYLYTVYNTIDSAFLYRYDMSGNLLKKKVLTFNFSDPTILIFPFAYGPTQVSPVNDSLLIYGNNASEIQFVNRFTLDKVKTIQMDDTQELNLAVNEGWVSMRPSGFLMDSTTVTFFGDLNKSTAIGNPDFWQYYRATIDWNGNILNKIHLGNTTIDNRSTYYVKANNNEYFSGSSPYASTPPFAAEYRQLLVFKVSGQSRDSLFIYGQKNHVSSRIIVDSNEDIFVLSYFSNAWSDNKVFSVITKIPSQLLVSIRENEIATSINVYPNPTTDYLKIVHSSNSLGYIIYNMKGQQIRNGNLGSDKQVNVRSLSTGTYFLSLIDNGKPLSRATVFIKE